MDNSPFPRLTMSAPNSVPEPDGPTLATLRSPVIGGGGPTAHAAVAPHGWDAPVEHVLAATVVEQAVHAEQARHTVLVTPPNDFHAAGYGSEAMRDLHAHEVRLAEAAIVAAVPVAQPLPEVYAAPAPAPAAQPAAPAPVHAAVPAPVPVPVPAPAAMPQRPSHAALLEQELPAPAPAPASQPLDREGLPVARIDHLRTRDIAREALRARFLAIGERRERRSAWEIVFILLAVAVAVLLSAPPLVQVLLAAHGVEA